MSNYNNRNYNNKNKSAENSDGGKWLAVICGFAVVFLALIYIIVSNIIGVWNPVAWVNRKKSSDDAANADKQPVAVDDKGNPYYSGVMYTLPKGLTFLNTLDEGAAPVKYSLADDEGETIIKGDGSVSVYVYLRATVLPENADDRAVTWECSAPESIKICYISASGSMSETPEAGSTNNYIYVGLIGNLYETVTITCRSVSNPDIYATCTVDQVVPLESLTYTAALTGGTTELVFGEEYTAAVTFEKKPGAIGTVIGTIDNPSWRIDISAGLYFKIQQYLQKSGFVGNDYGDMYFETNRGESTRALYASPYETFASTSDAGSYRDASPDAFNNAFKLGVRDCAASGTTQAILAVCAGYTYKGYGIGSVRLETSSACTFDVSNIWIDVTQITIDKDNIVFIPN